MTRVEKFLLLRDLARAVGNHPTCPESERRAAVARINFYNDKLERLGHRARA